MEIFDFDCIPDRRNTDCSKWDNRGYDTDQVTPMFVADMDYPSPPQVVDAILSRAAHGVYGYPTMPEAGWQAVIDWMAARHGLTLRREWLLYSPGVIFSMRAAVDALTEAGAPLVIQAPIYPAFYSVPRGARRPILDNRLVRDASGCYRMNLDQLEDFFRGGARTLLFCSPHNPSGRVWTRDELAALAALCVRYDITVISDEIHSDIILPGFTHTPLMALSGMAERTITLISATKTFNLGGMQTSTVIAPVEKSRQAIAEVLYGHGSSVPATLSIVAQTVAYQTGAPWLDQLLPYMDENCRLFDAALNACGLPTRRPEGTYLMWADASALPQRGDALVRHFITEGCVEPGNGLHFGQPDHVRFTLATSRALVVRAARNITAMMEAARG